MKKLQVIKLDQSMKMPSSIEVEVLNSVVGTSKKLNCKRNMHVVEYPCVEGGHQMVEGIGWSFKDI